MKILVKVTGEAAYHLQEFTLLLLKRFTPTRLDVTKSDFAPEVTVYMTGAQPVNPFIVLEEINQQFLRKYKNYFMYDIRGLEFENEEEKKQIEMWIVLQKLKE